MTTAIDSHDGEHESPRYRAVAELAEFWERVCDVDTFLTVSFNEETYGRHGFSRPDVLLGFVERTLEEVGYAGSYVIAVHDNRGTCYFHPHLLIKDDGDGMLRRIKREFRRYGDVDHAGDGQIRGKGAFIYLANRALEAEGTNRSDDTDRYSYRSTRKQRPTRRRRPRGRGRGKGTPTSVRSKVTI